LYNKDDFDKYMRIAGTVYDPKTGKPLAGVKVELRSKDGEVIMTTTTDENGNYVFNKVPKGKEYEINVDYPGEVFVEGKATDLYGQNGLAGVSINGQITGDDGSFKFNAYGTGAEDAYMDISGKVVHPKTKKPIPGVRVQLRSKDGTIVRNTVSDYKGDFIFKKVPKNKDYDIFVDYPTASVVNGVVTDHTGKGIEGKKIGDQITDKDGKFSLLTNNKGMLATSPYPPGTLEKYLIPFSKDNLSNALIMDEAMLGEFLNKFGDYSDKDLVFKVQIGAYLYAKNFQYFQYEKLDKVDKKLYDDNLTRFMLSTPYKTFRQAWTRQWEARKYPDHDAFVVIFYKGQRMLLSKNLMELLKADK
jgi:5-hydroxyisourate hydrolase-like protein (transthyretin family)